MILVLPEASAVARPARSGRVHESSGSPVGAFPRRQLFALIRWIETRLQLPDSERQVAATEVDLSSVAAETIRLPASIGDLARAPSDSGPGQSVGAPAPVWANALRSAALDLLIVYGHRIPDPALLDALAVGALTVEHDGELSEPAGLAAFWPTLDRRPSSAFTIRWHRADASRPHVVAAGEVWNRHSFLLNQTTLHRKSLHYLNLLLQTALHRRTVSPTGDVARSPGLPGRSPGTAALSRYLAVYMMTIGWRFLVGRIPSLGRRWTVFYAETDWPGLDVSTARRIPNPPGSFLADPFLVEDAGKTYCFVEELSFSDWRGCISAYELRQAGAHRIGKVIVEPFHMSFPYLFRYEGRLYMVPETSENRDIRVYECLGLPDRWRLAASLMTGVQAVDTMLFERDGRWWMMTNLDPAIGDGCSELHLFHSDSPLSDEWTPHPGNPVLIDTGRARNAGLLADGGVIHRVAQRQAFNTYGSDFSVNRIDLIDPARYRETPVEHRFGLAGGRSSRIHHLCSNGRFTVFDRFV
jgi:hypothetical protein